MGKDIKIIKEAVKAAKKKKEKPEDPNEVARKLRGLPKHHQVGRKVHAALAIKGGAGYRGEVVKVDDMHTYVKIDKNRTVKAPHHLVSAHEEVVHEETKEEKKDRLKREAEIATRSYHKFAKIENEKETHDERRKRHHEHERKMRREEDQTMKDKSVTEANSPAQAKSKLDKHAADLDSRFDSGDTSNKTKRVAQAVKAAYKIAMTDPTRKVKGSIVNPSKETIDNSKKNLSDFSKKTSADSYIKGDVEKAKKHMGHAKFYAREETVWDSDSKSDREVSHFHIINKSSGKVVGKAATMKSARRVRDKHDNNYGGYNHSIQPIFKEEVKTDPVKAHHKRQQIQKKIIDEGYQMKLFDVSPDLVKAVKEVMEGKKMSKDDIAGLAGDKKKVEPEDFEAMGRGEHKKPKHKHKKHHVKEEELVEADKPDIAHRSLYAQTYIKNYNKALKTNPGRQAIAKGEHAGYVAVSNKYGEEAAKKLKAFHSANANMKEEVEQFAEGNKENKFKKNLYVVKKGIKHATENLGFSPEDHVSMSSAFGHDKPTERDNMKALLKDYKRRGRSVTREEIEQVDEVRDPGSTYGVSTPLRKKAEYTSANGRHVAKVKRDRDWNEYRVELYTDGKHHKPADYHTDDKEEAHDNAKAMVAHAQKHEKPLKEETSLVSKIINKYSK